MRDFNFIALVHYENKLYTRLTPVCNLKGQQSGLVGYILEQA